MKTYERQLLRNCSMNQISRKSTAVLSRGLKKKMLSDFNLPSKRPEKILLQKKLKKPSRGS